MRGEETLQLCCHPSSDCLFLYPSWETSRGRLVSTERESMTSHYVVVLCMGQVQIAKLPPGAGYQVQGCLAPSLQVVILQGLLCSEILK